MMGHEDKAGRDVQAARDEAAWRRFDGVVSIRRAMPSNDPEAAELVRTLEEELQVLKTQADAAGTANRRSAINAQKQSIEKRI